MNNYLIIGTSNRLIEKKIKELIDLSNETIYFDMQFNSIEELLQEASYTSLFLDKKNIIVYNPKFFVEKKDSTEVEKLAEYLKNPNDITNIVFVLDEKADSKNKIYTILNNNKCVFDLLKDKVNINDQIIQYCKENKFTIDSGAITVLKQSLSSNCDLIFNELDKLFLYYGSPCKIEENVVKKNCSNIIEENNFKFVDLVISKNVEQSFNYLKELLIRKVEPLSLFNLLVREFRLMLLYKQIQNSDKNFSILTDTYKLQGWQLDKISRNAYSYKEKELLRIMKLLGEYDYKIKSGIMDKSFFLDVLLLDIFEK